MSETLAKGTPMNEEIVKRIVKELVELQLRVALLQGQLSQLNELAPE